MRFLTNTLVLLMLLLAFDSVNAQEGCITVRVFNESGQVISNALVSAGFGTMIKPGWGWGGGKPNTVKGYTDTNGICVLTGEGNGGEVGIAVSKDGYYGSGGFNIIFTNVPGIAFKRWQPWNPTTEVVLKRIGQAIPMYARSVGNAEIPVEGKDLGFDLEKGDWATPYGKGETMDIIFRLDKNARGVVTNRYGTVRLFDDMLTISFFNDGDGIQSVLVPPRGGRSSLRLPAMVPESGYATNVVKRIYQEKDKPAHSDIREDQNYFFRVRTKKDDKGNIVSALYGKIHGDFSDFDYGKLTFTYYLNPTPNDRNVEFDPQRNLFKNLSSLEEVREP